MCVKSSHLKWRRITSYPNYAKIIHTHSYVLVFSFGTLPAMSIHAYQWISIYQCWQIQYCSTFSSTFSFQKYRGTLAYSFIVTFYALIIIALMNLDPISETSTGRMSVFAYLQMLKMNVCYITYHQRLTKRDFYRFYVANHSLF